MGQWETKTGALIILLHISRMHIQRKPFESNNITDIFTGDK